MDTNACYANPNIILSTRRNHGDQDQENNVEESTQRNQNTNGKKLANIMKILFISVFLIVVVVLILTILVITLLVHQEQKQQLLKLKSLNKLAESCASAGGDHECATFSPRSCNSSTFSSPNHIISCRALSKSSPSGFYNILSSSGSIISKYCDMKKTCGNLTGGWMRITNLNMKQPYNKCPTGLCESTSPQRTCRRCNNTCGIQQCSFVTYEVGVPYSHVCGTVIGYQVGNLEAYSSIGSVGVDGVSLTAGNLEANIWTFVAAEREIYDDPGFVCPCINPTDQRIMAPPPSIGNHYFCDTASVLFNSGTIFYKEDPLWDGKGCTGQNKCCTFNNPPWFYRNLQKTITESIHMKVSVNAGPDNEDIAIQVVQIFVQ